MAAGKLTTLPSFSGFPIGDDVRQKGAGVTRIILYQAAGKCAGPAEEVGNLWAEGASALGGDMVYVTETRTTE